MFRKNTIFLLNIFLVVGIFFVIVFYKLIIPNTKPTTTKNLITNQEISKDNNFKIYRNEEWGFEFQYPNDWSVHEEPKGLGFYSKFLLTTGPSYRKDFISLPIIVNVVLPEFANRTFFSVNPATSTVIIAGTHGVKYEYEFEETLEVDIVLPFGQNKIIIGTEKKYEDIFNKIVASFKFLE